MATVYTIRTIDPLTKTGTQLAADLNAWSVAAETWHQDTSRPSYAQTGTIWTDTTSDPIYKVKWYTGTGSVDLNFVDFNKTAATIAFRGASYSVQSNTQSWGMSFDGSENWRLRDGTAGVDVILVEKSTPASTVYLKSSGAVGILGNPPSANAGLWLIGTNALGIKERASAPTADSTYGKVWVKDDDTFWFQDGAGTDKQVITRDIQLIPLIIAASDETTPLSTGTAKVTFRMPFAMTLTDVKASLTAAGTGAALLTVDVNEDGTTILSTKLTFDASEKTTTTATTPRVISDTTLAADAEITIDIDQVDTDNLAAGLKVTLIGYPT